MRSLELGRVPSLMTTTYSFNATIRQWGREIVLPVPKADVEKLKILMDSNLIGERVRVEVEL